MAETEWTSVYTTTMANPSRSLQEDLQILRIIITARVDAIASDVEIWNINLEGEDEVSDAESDPHASTWKKGLLLSSAARCRTREKTRR